MKKIINIFLILGLILNMFIPITALAETKYEGILTGDNVNIRAGTGIKYKIVAQLAQGAIIDLESNKEYPNEGGCKGPWYKIFYKVGETGYICSQFINIREKIPENTDGVPKDEFQKSLKEQGFPSSYWNPLSKLKEAHPNWEFEAIITNLDWKESVNAQSILGKSLIQSSLDGYKSSQPGSYNYLTDKFKVFEGSNWYVASNEAVAYYLDPRNFLNETQIFQFEKLEYDAKYQTAESVITVFGKDSFLSAYSNVFLEAGKKYNINPIYIASRVRQEVGVNPSAASSGKPFTYNEKTYSGIYNLFNIGATTGSNPVVNGLIWAAGGTDGSGKSWGRPWTTIEKSIYGGTEFLSKSFISIGQSTSYLQKFNVAPGADYKPHVHQYMTNIKAPSQEAVTTYNSYKKMNLINNKFTFSIPVFKDMGEKSELPNPGNPNNHLSAIKINNNELLGFSHDKFTYDFAISKEATKVNITADTINKKAKIENLGEINTPNEKNTHTIKVTAENGKVQEYTINLYKSDAIELSPLEILNKAGYKTDGQYITNIKKGQTVSDIITSLKKISPTIEITIKDKNGTVITDGILTTSTIIELKNRENTLINSIAIKGDLNSDGEITIHDLLSVQKHLLNAHILETTRNKAGDINNDGKITIHDLLMVQKHLLGYKEIGEEE